MAKSSLGWKIVACFALVFVQVGSVLLCTPRLLHPLPVLLLLLLLSCPC